MRFEHLGIATDDADGLAELLSELLSVPVVHEETFGEYDIVFLDLGNGYLELIEPRSEGNTVAEFLERRGPGIHHVAVETDDIEAALDAAREMGLGLLDESPRPGAWGHTVAFLDPGTTGGVLVEFVEQ